MRRALVVGIDYYPHAGTLYGCVNDAHEVKSVLERHGDGSVNFDVKLLTGTGKDQSIDRKMLKSHVEKLFADEPDTALFYFAGHGWIEATGGYLMTSEGQTGDDGLPLSEILHLANTSKAKNKIIVLDSCHSGLAGNRPSAPGTAELSDGMTILTASTADQYAEEDEGAGVFTTLFVDALHGAASNLVGDISPGGIYAHIDQSLGQWSQRPVFKTNVTNFVSLRKVPPPISQDDLRRITEFFPDAGFEFPLDPSYEPENEDADPGNTAKFKILQNMRNVNLVKPVGTDHMYHAAIKSKACKLTTLGEHYRRLVEKGRI